MPLKDLNKKIIEAENKAKKDIESVEQFIKETFPLINISIKDNSNIADYIKESLGIYVLPTYQSEFNAYTAQFKKHTLFYTIRDNIYGFYSLANAEIKENCITMNWGEYQSPFIDKEETKGITLKEFKNGRRDLKKSDDLIEIIRIAKKIKEWSKN